MIKKVNGFQQPGALYVSCQGMSRLQHPEDGQPLGCRLLFLIDRVTDWAYIVKYVTN